MICGLSAILTQDEACWLLQQPDTREPNGVRDFLLIRMMLNYGLRVYELTEIRWGDVDLHSKRIIVEKSRGGKRRALSLNNTDIVLFEKWFNALNYKLNGNSFLFSTPNGKQLSGQYIINVLKRYGKRAILQRQITPSLLRHTFAINCFKDSEDIRLVQRKLGHSNIETTKNYLQTYNMPKKPVKLNITNLGQ
ncbi:tyrosine-type recombinase/integrase [Natranaerobius trueperi]|uniref:tyrosine-type recombinase/integrase n=1 Tax=Natranaerobius trueperi TaxID=759412 RepID=UPI00130354BF|nr:tyrosine-type recombinase/integrase [Natranaerobius trueperi]